MEKEIKNIENRSDIKKENIKKIEKFFQNLLFNEPIEKLRSFRFNFTSGI